MNLHKKIFVPISNSTHGEVDETTKFYFSEVENVITATYKGGTIQRGSIIGTRRDAVTVELLYHCITKEGELKAGVAHVLLSVNSEEKLILDMDWKWLNGDRKKGTSKYIELK